MLHMDDHVGKNYAGCDTKSDLPSVAISCFQWGPLSVLDLHIQHNCRDLTDDRLIIHFCFISGHNHHSLVCLLAQKVPVPTFALCHAIYRGEKKLRTTALPKTASSNPHKHSERFI